MAGRRQTLGELELEVLKTVWDRQPCTVAEVADVMAERRGSAPTTVLTVMQRLHAKGFLRRRKRGGLFHYATTQARGKVLAGLIGQFVEKVLDGSPVPLVAYLAEVKGLTRKQAAALREIAEKIDKKPR